MEALLHVVQGLFAVIAATSAALLYWIVKDWKDSHARD